MNILKYSKLLIQIVCCIVNVTLFSRVTLIRNLQSTSDLDHFHACHLSCSRVNSRNDPISDCRIDSAVPYSFIYTDRPIDGHKRVRVPGTGMVVQFLRAPTHRFPSHVMRHVSAVVLQPNSALSPLRCIQWGAPLCPDNVRSAHPVTVNTRRPWLTYTDNNASVTPTTTTTTPRNCRVSSRRRQSQPDYTIQPVVNPVVQPVWQPVSYVNGYQESRTVWTISYI